MDEGILFVFFLRLLVPLLIFRWPLFGAIASWIVDSADTNIVKIFDTEIPQYVTTDKILDIYYLTIEVVVSRRWINGRAKNASVLLYLWRLIGVILFTLNPSQRILLFLAPNIFEHFFLFYTFLQTIKKETKKKIWLDSYQKLFIVIFLLWLTKIPQELVLHVYKISYPVETFFQWVNKTFLSG